MKKKIFSLIIIIMIITLILLLVFCFNRNNQDSDTNENKTIEEQTTDVLSIDEEDKNIIGYITISELGIEKAPIADGTDSNIIGKYVGHFESTSYLEGNVCLCSHNRGSKVAYFENLKNAKQGMKVEYITKYETKTYIINEIKEIEETDLTVLEPTEENQITLITCIANQRAKRLCVIGTGD